MNYECMRCTKRNSRGSWIIIKRSFASGDYMHRHLFHIKNMKMKKNKQIANILTTLRAKRSLPLSFPFSVFARAHVAFVDHQYNSNETLFFAFHSLDRDICRWLWFLIIRRRTWVRATSKTSALNSGFLLRFAPNHDRVHRAWLSKEWRNSSVSCLAEQWMWIEFGLFINPLVSHSHR